MDRRVGRASWFWLFVSIIVEPAVPCRSFQTMMPNMHSTYHTSKYRIVEHYGQQQEDEAPAVRVRPTATASSTASSTDPDPKSNCVFHSGGDDDDDDGGDDDDDADGIPIYKNVPPLNFGYLRSVYMSLLAMYLIYIVGVAVVTVASVAAEEISRSSTTATNLHASGCTTDTKHYQTVSGRGDYNSTIRINDNRLRSSNDNRLRSSNSKISSEDYDDDHIAATATDTDTDTEDDFLSFPFRYVYDATRLILPVDGYNQLRNAHGLEAVVGNDPRIDGIYLTYENNLSTSSSTALLGTSDKLHCLVKWPIDAKGVGKFVDDSSVQICTGEPHGLTLSAEQYHQKQSRDDNDEEEEGAEQHQQQQQQQQQQRMFLYHVNNDQILSKTDVLTGELIWQNRVVPNVNSIASVDSYKTIRQQQKQQKQPIPYRPTWMAVPPDGPYIYLCDGYGSNYVYLLWRHDGTFVQDDDGNTVHWGGHVVGKENDSNNTTSQPDHGLFATNHGCLYDTTTDQIVVADRENGRIEYFDYYTWTDETVGGWDKIAPTMDVDGRLVTTKMKAYGKFRYSHTTDLRRQTQAQQPNRHVEGNNTDFSTADQPPSLGNSSRPCILRRQVLTDIDASYTFAALSSSKIGEGNNRRQVRYGVVPDLAGKVAIVSRDVTRDDAVQGSTEDNVVYVINIAAELGPQGHLHPHDAQMLPNGDVIVATWNPGRLSYWKRVQIGKEWIQEFSRP